MHEVPYPLYLGPRASDEYTIHAKVEPLFIEILKNVIDATPSLKRVWSN